MLSPTAASKDRAAWWPQSEKVKAAGDAAAILAMGGTPHQVVRDYRRKVRANHKGLGKG